MPSVSKNIFNAGLNQKQKHLKYGTFLPLQTKACLLNVYAFHTQFWSGFPQKKNKPSSFTIVGVSVDIGDAHHPG